MSAVLEFTLGLQVNKFLEGIGLSTGKLLSLVSVTEALGKVMDGVWTQIERGAALNDLSKRTGESVATLYQLQKAFIATGVPADSLGFSLFQMQKSLGGVSESGEATNATFKKLGLNLHDLKQMDSGQAFKQIIGALGKLNSNDAAKAAGSIFGRSGAADAVQMSRSMDEFGEAYERAAAQGKTFARVAETFDRLEKSAARLKEIFAPLFLGIAKYIAEPLDQAITKLLAIDLGPFAEKVGAWMGLLFESTSELGEILLVSLQVALEKGVFYAEKFGVTLATIITESLMIAIPAGFKLGMQALAESGGASLDIDDKRAIKRKKQEAADLRAGKVGQFRTPEAREALARKAEREMNEIEMGMNDRHAGLAKRRKDTITEISTTLGPNIKAAINNVQDVWERNGRGPDSESWHLLMAKITNIQSKWAAQNPPPKPDKPGDTDTAPEEFTAAAPKADNVFARMGFITNGAASTDYSRKTAENTKDIVTHTGHISETIDRISAQNIHYVS